MNNAIPVFSKTTNRTCSGVLDAVGVREIPEKSATEWAIALFLFVASCLYLRFFYNFTAFNPDEGISLQGAQRILNGEVPYRDFFTINTPGLFYWTALFFRIFGDSMLVARATLVVYGGLFSVFTYFLARRVCKRRVALITVYLLTITCLPYKFAALHNWDSTLWASLALYFAVLLLETSRWAFAATAGAFTSITFLFEQPKGGGLVLGLAMGFGLIILLDRKGRFTVSHVWASLAGITLPFVVTIGYFMYQRSLSLMLADWLWPLGHYSLVNRIPYGWLELTPASIEKIFAAPWPSCLATLMILSPYFLFPVLPILALGFLAASVRRLWKKQGSPEKSCHHVLVSATLAGLLISTLVGRPDLSHILFQAPLFFLVLAWSLEESCVRSNLWGTLRPFFSIYLLLTFTALGLSLLMVPLNAKVVSKTRRGVLKANQENALLEELKSMVPPGRKIFIYPYQPLYYYLSATFNATGYEFLFPGMNTSEQFDRALREVDEARPPVVLLQPSFPELIAAYWPATKPGDFSTYERGMEFLMARYKPCKSLDSGTSWRFVFMVRKDLSCSGPL
jgi:4-amino-4-deoxy-L-arabinose transferase-like glycosyltransferase